MNNTALNGSLTSLAAGTPRRATLNTRSIVALLALPLALSLGACTKSEEGAASKEHAGHEHAAGTDAHAEHGAANTGGDSNAAAPAASTVMAADNTLVEMVKAGGHIMPPKGQVSSDPSPATQASPEFDVAFGKVLTEYYAMRKALAGDSNADVKAAAARLNEGLTLAKSVQSPATTDADKQLLVQNLDEMAAASAKLAAGQDLKADRDTFALLTKGAMYVVAFHYKGATPEIFFCPMKQLAWLQESADIGNPYYGSEMLTCGVKVAKGS